MTKGLKISILLLISLLGIYLLNVKKQGNLESSSTAIFTGNQKNITKVLIQQGEEAIELSLNDTTWEIAGNDTLIIKSRSIDNLFDKVLKVNRGTIISENPNKYDKYAIDDSTGTHLAIIDANGDTIEYYIFGRSKSDYSRSYVRIGNNPNVYLADENVIYMLSTKETYWGEIPKEEIQSPPPADTINN